MFRDLRFIHSNIEIIKIICELSTDLDIFNIFLIVSLVSLVCMHFRVKSCKLSLNHFHLSDRVETSHTWVSELLIIIGGSRLLVLMHYRGVTVTCVNAL